MGGATEETEEFLQIINRSIAAGSSESYSVIANRTRCRIAISLVYNSIAFNALSSKNKLLPASRRTAISIKSPNKSPVAASGLVSGAGQQSSGAALLSLAIAVKNVRGQLSQLVRTGGDLVQGPLSQVDDMSRECHSDVVLGAEGLSASGGEI